MHLADCPNTHSCLYELHGDFEQRIVPKTLSKKGIEGLWINDICHFQIFAKLPPTRTVTASDTEFHEYSNNCRSSLCYVTEGLLDVYTTSQKDFWTYGVR
jgi:hypothetical protein